MDAQNNKLRADRDQIYAAADKQAIAGNSDRANDELNAANINLSADSGGGLALPEDRIEANLQDSSDWDKQQNIRRAGRMQEDDYPEF